MRISLITILFISHLALGKEVNEFPIYALENVDNDFKNNIDGNNFQFLSVCGYACETPGVGDLELLYCYSQFSKTKVIDNTGDFISSNKQALFKTQAAKYAYSYNTKLLNYLDLNHMRTCSDGQQWTTAWDKVYSYLTNTNDDLASIDPPLKFDGIFKIHLRKKHDPAQLMSTTCSIFFTNGINQKVHFSVSNTTRNNNRWQTKLQYNFTCFDGSYNRL